MRKSLLIEAVQTIGFVILFGWCAIMAVVAIVAPFIFLARFLSK